MLAAANAGLLPQTHHAVPLAYAAVQEHQYENHAPAQYDFKYSVHDPHTRDIKEQQESRQGDNVQGQYSLVEPDGHRRTVQYSADAHNGFNAVVHREGPTHHEAPVAIAHAAPIAHHTVAAPIAYTQHLAAPVHHTSIHQAPIAIAHSAPIAYAQHHHGATLAYAAPLSHHQLADSHATITHHGNQHHY